MPDGSSRGFTWLIDAKSVITFPCPEKPLDRPASMKSGDWRGAATASQAVDVSTDGGINWQARGCMSRCCRRR